jgi:hypothetical protein
MKILGLGHVGAMRVEHSGAGASSPAEGDRQQRHARPRLGLVALGVCLVAIGAVLASVVIRGGKRAVPAKAVPLSTTTVDQGDLVETRRYHGVLGYPSRGSVSLSGSGTVTSLPRDGQILSEGTSVAGVDDRAIGALFGRTSLYRTLRSANPAGAELAAQVAQANLLAAQATLSQATRSSKAGRASSAVHQASVIQAQVGVDEARDRLDTAQQALRQAQTPQQGPDVALVAADMTKLGYYHGSGSSWNAELEDAVRTWQEHIGATPTGEIDPNDVLVVKGPARVSEVRGQLGSAPAAVTFSLDSLARRATFKIHNGAPGALAPGRHVTLSAAGDIATGRVMRVETSHQIATVQVAIDRSSRLDRVGSSQVSMTVTIADRHNVLTVPTQALLALASGGYALQLPAGRLLAVRTGIVQAGDIEISGPGVHAGLRVVSVT